jgi:phosphonate transport system substrate-binding protein
VAARPSLDADAKHKLREFFLAYGRDAREKQILKTLTFAGFVPSDNSQLVPIRQLELARERAKLDADSALNADDKAKKLAEIDHRLAELGKQLAAAK